MTKDGFARNHAPVFSPPLCDRAGESRTRSAPDGCVGAPLPLLSGVYRLQGTYSFKSDWLILSMRGAGSVGPLYEDLERLSRLPAGLQSRRKSNFKTKANKYGHSYVKDLEACFECAQSIILVFGSKEAPSLHEV